MERIPRVLTECLTLVSTNLEKQAHNWALTKKEDHIVSVFRYQPVEDLKILHFPEMTDEWLDFVVDCRRCVKHDYDIVEGPMADNQISNSFLHTKDVRSHNL